MKTPVRLAMMSGALLATAHAAHAAEVTLYGLFDTSLTYVWNANADGKNLVGLGNGNLLGNRFGVKGAEDLGGGLKAIFTLENGFNPNTGALGQGNRMFGRQAFVGLDSARWGTLTFGASTTRSRMSRGRSPATSTSAASTRHPATSTTTTRRRAPTTR